MYRKVRKERRCQKEKKGRRVRAQNGRGGEEEDEVIAKDGELHSGGRDLTPEVRLCLGHSSMVHFIQTVWVRVRGQWGVTLFQILRS